MRRAECGKRLVRKGWALRVPHRLRPYCRQRLDDSVLPVSGCAAARGYGDNENKIGLNRVGDAVAEDWGEAAPHLLIEGPPAIRRFDDECDGLLEAGDAAQVQGRLRPSVAVGSFVVFSERLRVEPLPHRPSERRTWTSASSPGIVCTRPCRTSSRRRLASVAQSPAMRWASASEGFPPRFSRFAPCGIQASAARSWDSHRKAVRQGGPRC